MSPSDWVRHLEASAGGAASLDSSLPSGAVVRSEAGDRDGEAWRRVADGAALGWSDLADPGEGPLKPWPETSAIEVWTEVELASLHALWRLARRTGAISLRHRLLAAARWHVEHTQPDNATNRPWGLHAFVLEGSAESGVYAATLLHNALAIRGMAEPVSAWILRDAAAEIRAAVGSSPAR